MLRMKFIFKTSCTWQNLEFLRETRSHPEVMKYLFHTKKITRIEQENWYDEYKLNHNHLMWIVYDDQSNSPIAYIQYHIDSLLHRRCTAGYVIAPEFNYCAKKYDTNIIRMMVKNIKGWKDEIHRLQVKIFPEDILRLRKLTKAGFEVDGIIRDYIFKDGEFRDVYVLSYIL